VLLVAHADGVSDQRRLPSVPCRDDGPHRRREVPRQRPAQEGRLLAGREVLRAPPVQPRQRQGGEQEDAKRRDGGGDTQPGGIDQRQRRDEEQRHQVAEDAVLEMIAADDQRVVEDVSRDHRRCDRHRQPRRGRPAGPAARTAPRREQRAARRGHGQRQPDPDAVLDDEAREVAPTHLGPGRRDLGVVGVGQPRAVSPAAPEQVCRDRQQRTRGEDRRAHRSGARPGCRELEQHGGRHRQQPIRPRQAGERGGSRQPETPGQAALGAQQSEGLQQPPGEAEVPELRLEPRAQPGEEGAVGADAEQGKGREQGPPAVQRRRQPQASDRAPGEGERPEAAEQAQPAGGPRWIEPRQPPSGAEQQRPEKAGVSLDRQERRRVPDQAVSREQVGDIAERDVGVVGLEPEEPPPDHGEHHRGAEHPESRELPVAFRRAQEAGFGHQLSAWALRSSGTRRRGAPRCPFPSARGGRGVDGWIRSASLLPDCR